MVSVDDTSKRLSVIYIITNAVNGKQYVGQTSKGIDFRWRQHLTKARNGSPYLFHQAIRKYGESSFSVTILEEVDGFHLLQTREQYWIGYFNTLAPNGYNLTKGGDGVPGHSPSQETRDKISQKLKGRPHPISLETREKLRLANSGKPGKPLTDDQRRKLADANRGRIKTESEIKRISEKLKGHPVSEETREKLRKAHTGRTGNPLSENHKQKLILANTGRPMPDHVKSRMNSPESIAKRAATKRRNNLLKKGLIQE